MFLFSDSIFDMHRLAVLPQDPHSPLLPVFQRYIFLHRLPSFNFWLTNMHCPLSIRPVSASCQYESTALEVYQLSSGWNAAGQNVSSQGHFYYVMTNVIDLFEAYGVRAHTCVGWVRWVYGWAGACVGGGGEEGGGGFWVVRVILCT